MNRACDGENRRVAAVGWTLSCLVGVVLIYSAATKFLGTEAVRDEFALLEMRPESVWPIGVAQLVSVVLYMWSRTGVLGAVLITAYMGGGVALHGRVGDSVVPPLITAVACWVGLALRDPLVLRVTPWRRAG